MNIRKLLVTVTIPVLAALPLTACSTAPEPMPVADVRVTAPDSTTTTPPTTTSDLTDTQKDRIFLQVISEYGLGGQEAIDAAHAVCDALDAGVPAETVAWTALESLGDPDQAGALLGAGVETYCPEYSDEMSAIGGGAQA